MPALMEDARRMRGGGEGRKGERIIVVIIIM